MSIVVVKPVSRAVRVNVTVVKSKWRQFIVVQ